MEANDLAYVGDTDYDIEATLAAGSIAILVVRVRMNTMDHSFISLSQISESCSFSPDIIFHSLATLPVTSEDSERLNEPRMVINTVDRLCHIRP